MIYSGGRGGIEIKIIKQLAITKVWVGELRTLGLCFQF